MPKYKIAYILTPIEFGGAEKVSLTFLKNVDRSKYHIAPVLLTRPWEKENFFIQALENENYPLCKVPVAIKPRSEGRDYFRFIRCYRMIHSFLKKGLFDLVHTHGYFADIVGIPAAKILGIPNISTCHGFISNDRKLKVYNRLDHFTLRFADKIIAVSDGIRNDLVKNGIKEHRIIMIQNAVNGSYNSASFTKNRREKRQLLDIHEKEFVIGYVGRLSEEKGVKYLIEASSLLYESGVAVRVFIIGEGPQRKELEKIIKDKGMEHKIIFTGFQADVQSWLPSLDVFILPSLTEGTPMALLEAMSFGVPVIASRVGGVPKLVTNGVNGYMFEAGDSHRLSQLIKTLFHDPVLRKTMSQKALNLINKQYTVADWCKVIQAQYNIVAKRDAQDNLVENG